MKEFLTIKEIATMWGLTERAVRKYCQSGKIAGIKRDKKSYLIPQTALPPDRINAKKYSENNLLNILKYEKDNHIKGGVYHKIQIAFTYNSNHIEGSTLTEEQTRYIFETATLGETNGVRVNDIIETTNHFKCIDYVIDHATKPITEKIVKELHRILKTQTVDEKQKWFRVGDYKLRSNEVGGQSTTPPAQVPTEMAKLIDRKIENFDQIVEFHQNFETIHPFQDGNGRVGRLVMLHHCLLNSVVPIIITDDKKLFYYRGLREWKNDRGFLLDTCKHMQDLVTEWLKYFACE
jgi:Fic family protein